MFDLFALFTPADGLRIDQPKYCANNSNCTKNRFEHLNNVGYEGEIRISNNWHI